MKLHYANLKSVLDKEKKKALRERLIIDSNYLSKKLNLYNSIDFKEDEKQIILNFFQEVYSQNYDFDWLFEKTERKDTNSLLPNEMHNKRLKIAYIRAKEFYGLSLRKIADKIPYNHQKGKQEFSEQTLSNYVHGVYNIPASNLKILAEIFDVTYEFLVGESDIPVSFKYSRIAQAEATNKHLWINSQKKFKELMLSIYKVDENDKEAFNTYFDQNIVDVLIDSMDMMICEFYGLNSESDDIYQYRKWSLEDLPKEDSIQYSKEISENMLWMIKKGYMKIE